MGINPEKAAIPFGALLDKGMDPGYFLTFFNIA